MAQRQLAAIMFTDLVGYSALTQRNEALAIELLEKHWALLRPVFASCDGREIKTIGDGFLIEFPSALQAVRAGLAMQATLDGYNIEAEQTHHLNIRIGIHTGDVERRGDDVFGDGVNIAARLEPLATSGGICISEPVYASVQNNLDVPFYSMGKQTLKNISQPIVVYSNHPHNKATFIKSKRRSIIAGMAIATVIVLLIIITFTWIKEEPPTVVTTAAEKKPGEKIAAAVVADRKSVAVLPFTNRSDEKKDAFFTDGLHDDLLTHLSKITDMKVISRTSVMGYRNTQKNMKTIGAELGVATLLEGSVQRAQNQVRINVQLIDVNTDEHLWAEIYDRELTAANIFAIQSEIATAIANALQATLSPEEQERLAAVPTEDLAAYEAYLLGKQRMATRNSEALAEAVDYFQRAIDLDPMFALAYVGLGDSYFLQTEYSDVSREKTLSKAKTAIANALKLDDRLGEAYTSLASLRQAMNDDDGAEIVYKWAMELNPNYATTYHWYGTLLMKSGRADEALKRFRKANELDPRSIIINHAIAAGLTMSGRFDEALRQHKKVIEIDPNFPFSYTGIASLYWSAYGRLDEAYVWLKKGHAFDPDDADTLAMLGTLYLHLEDPAQAESWTRKALELGPHRIWPNAAMEYLHWFRGEEDQALDYARKVLAIKPDWADALSHLRIHDIQVGQYARARKRYEKAFPALLMDDRTEITLTNLRAAVDLAYVLQLSGEHERANLLLDSSLTFIQTMPRLGFGGSGIADVMIYSLQGNIQQSLAVLRQAVDQGWRVGWMLLELEPNLEPLRDSPQFQAMVEEIRTDMASQLKRVRMLEQDGERPVNPDSDRH